MDYEKSVPFKNWTSKKFEGLFGGDMYKFEAGGTYSVPQSQALHFAKQLAVRELHALGTVRGEMLSDIDMKEYTDKCFPVKASSSPAEPGTFERIDIAADETAKAADPIPENKTVNDEQDEEDDEDTTVTDAKNQAGQPKFKTPVGRPRK